MLSDTVEAYESGELAKLLGIEEDDKDEFWIGKNWYDKKVIVDGRVIFISELRIGKALWKALPDIII